MELTDARFLMRALYNRANVLCFGHKHVSSRWENMNGIQFVLAADNAPGKDYAREISVIGKEISVSDILVA
jgi:hypothetical protein